MAEAASGAGTSLPCSVSGPLRGPARPGISGDAPLTVRGREGPAPGAAAGRRDEALYGRSARPRTVWTPERRRAAAPIQGWIRRTTWVSSHFELIAESTKSAAIAVPMPK